jgi:hypothetical protein
VYRPKCIKDEGTTCPDREAVKQRQQHVSVYKLLEVWVHQLNLVCGLGFARSVLFDNLDDLKSLAIDVSVPRQHHPQRAHDPFNRFQVGHVARSIICSV